MKIIINEGLKNIKVIEQGKYDKEVELQKTEYTILLYLYHNNETYISTRLLSTIAHGNEHCVDRLSEVHISNIRKKINKNIILTRKGEGHMLNRSIIFEFVGVKSREEILLAWLHENGYFGYTNDPQKYVIDTLQKFKNR